MLETISLSPFLILGMLPDLILKSTLHASPLVGALPVWADPRKSVVVFGCSGLFFITMVTLWWVFIRDFVSDDFIFGLTLAGWIQNLIFFALVMQYEERLWSRQVFLYSAHLASAGPYGLYYMYCLWLIFDFLLMEHDRSHLYIFFKVFFAAAYTFTSTWFVGDLMPGIVSFYETMRIEQEPDPLERPTEETEEFIF